MNVDWPNSQRVLLRPAPGFTRVPRWFRITSILLLMASMLSSAEPLRLDGGGPAPDLLTDRMQFLFDTFDENAALGETPPSVMVVWDDFAYTLSASDYLAYREGERNFLQTVARVRIERVPFWSPRVLWRRYWWALGGFGLLVIIAGSLLLLLRRRRKTRHLASQPGGYRYPLPTGQPVAAETAPVLCLYPLSGSPFPLQQQCTTIGSQEGNLFRLSNRGVSPHHARIWRTREDAWYIEDLGSPFGTLVDGQPVSRHWLQAGSTVRLGEWQARVEWSHPHLPSHPPVSRVPIHR